MIKAMKVPAPIVPDVKDQRGRKAISQLKPTKVFTGDQSLFSEF